MNISKPSLLLLTFTVVLFSCKAPKPDNQTTESVISEDVQVYYFHNTKRCATCNAVENETRVAMEMYYQEHMQDGQMGFISLNLEEEKGKEMAKSLQVSGQALLIVKGDSRINLTNEGFMNARSNPAKFHEILKARIDNLLL